MGQLTNLYVSQSYQGLLKMTDSTNGLTSTLQTVQTGDGDNSPLQMSLTQVNISGSLTLNGQPITGGTVDTGSLVTTSSFNAYTSSVDLRFDGIELETGSLQNQINGLATTGSLSGYTTVTTFNNYTGSNDAKVNELISKTGSYATITGQTALSSSIASTDLSQNNRLTALESVTGSINRNGLITTGSIGGTQSITGSLNVEGTITATSASFTYVNTVYETASVIYSSGSNQLGDASNDTQTLWGTVNLPSGPLDITGSLKASGSLHTIVGNTTLDGNVDITTGNLNVYGPQARFVSDVIVTGSLEVTNGITGSLQGTASYAVNAVTASIASDLIVYGKNNNASTLTKGTIVRIVGANGDNPLFDTASWTDDANSANTLGMLTTDVAPNAFTNIVAQGTVIGINTNGMTAGDMLYLSSSGQYTNVQPPAPYHEVRLGQVLRPQLNNGSAYISVDNGYELSELHDVDITNPVVGDLLVYRSGSYGQWVNETGGEIGFATTGSNTFIGNQTITGSLDIRSGSLDLFSNNTTVNTDLYLTNSLGGQSNIIKGWGDNLTLGGPGTLQTNYTGSLRITGSNNTVSLPQLRATANGFGADLQGYISGSDNIISANNSGIYLNTGSQLFPKTQNNILGNSSFIGMNFTTSSLAGGHPIITNNLMLGGGMFINSNSGSITTVGQNAVLGGAITSTQNFVTNTRPTIAGNNIIGNVILNHISSSINYQQNYNNSPITVNNHLSSSIVNNNLTVTNNTFLGGGGGQGHSIYVSGSQSSNAIRNISSNLIGGFSNVVSSSFVSSSQANLNASIIYGTNLAISASHVSLGGTALFGRFNDTGSNLADAQQVVFAVGTGTGAGSRRTGFLIDSGSNVRISGSFQVTGSSVLGSTSINGVTNVLTVTGSQTIQHSVAGQPALTVIAQGTGQPALTITGSINATSTGDHTIFGNSLSVSGSVNVRNVMNLTPQNPLPSGTIGDLAVSGSNLFFYNGAWTQIV